MECMFFLLNFLYNIYLFTFVFKVCLFILVPVMCNLFPKFWFSVFVNFPSPNIFVVFFLPWIVMGTLSVNNFQSNLFDILYDIRLSSTLLWTFFSSVIFCVCSLLKFTNTENQKHSPNLFSITPLFNLLALRNKLNPKSVLMECMFFLLNFLYNIYLFTFVFKICLFIWINVVVQKLSTGQIWFILYNSFQSNLVWIKFYPADKYDRQLKLYSIFCLLSYLSSG
jgi:hypothetical protein